MTVIAGVQAEVVAGSCALFEGLSAATLDVLAAASSEQVAAAGTVLWEAGADGDDVVVVATGGLRGGDLEFGPGAVVGELASLRGEARSMAVHAVRDSVLLRIDGSAFRQAVERDHSLALRVAQLLAGRVPAQVKSADERTTVIAVVGLGQPEGLALFARRLRRALTRVGPTAVVSGPAEAAGGLPSTRFVVLLADERRAVGGRASEGWTERCLRQADEVLYVAAAGDDPQVRAVEQAHVAGARRLVLLQEPATVLPRGTAAWLDGRAMVGAGVRAHHHVRLDRRADVDRLARHLAGSARGLVLGGGGARGFAHLGAMGALEAAGVPVDAVGGTSIGAIMGAAWAMGWDHQTRVDKATEGFVGTRFLVAPTWPAVALSSSHRLTRALRSEHFFGDACIEDLWTPYFCVSANLSTAEPVVHRRGPLWWAVRASIALPGVLPPVHAGGELLVDGGVLCNLPVDVMRTGVGGDIIAVDLEPELDLRAVEPFPPDVSGWRLLGRRLNPLAATPRVPSLVHVVMRAREVAARQAERTALATSDVRLHLRPPTGNVGPLDFRTATALVPLAEAYTAEHLALAGLARPSPVGQARGR